MGKTDGGLETPAIDLVEFYISRAEIAYRSGKVEESLVEARTALSLCHYKHFENKKTAIRIFIARGLSKLGDIEGSNAEYRALIDDKIYLPPIILGLMHNNLIAFKDDKAKSNMGLIKLYFPE